MMNKHVYIGLCGYPKSGKTTLADFLCKKPHVRTVDDGRPLRNGVKAIFGCSEEDVTTQEGKAREYDLPGGRKTTIRGLLGHLGDDLEARYSDFVMPFLAMRFAEANIEEPSIVILPSVRKTQGLYIREMGGEVVEIVREGTYPVYDFDKYERTSVSLRVVNDGPLAKLEEEAERVYGVALSVLRQKHLKPSQVISGRDPGDEHNGGHA